MSGSDRLILRAELTSLDRKDDGMNRCEVIDASIASRASADLSYITCPASDEVAGGVTCICDASLRAHPTSRPVCLTVVFEYRILSDTILVRSTKLNYARYTNDNSNK